MQNDSPLDIIKNTILFSQYMAEGTTQDYAAWKAKYERPTSPTTQEQVDEATQWGEYRAHGGKLEFTAWQEEQERNQ